MMIWYKWSLHKMTRLIYVFKKLWFYVKEKKKKNQNVPSNDFYAWINL